MKSKVLDVLVAVEGEVLTVNESKGSLNKITLDFTILHWNNGLITATLLFVLNE